MVFRPHFDYLVGMSVTAKEGRTEKHTQACRPIRRPKECLARAQSDSVEGGDEEARQADDVAGGVVCSIHCVHKRRSFRQ